MRNTIIYAILFALIFSFAACDEDCLIEQVTDDISTSEESVVFKQSDESRGDSEGYMEQKPSGIYLNGELVSSLGSAFCGGAIADPSKGSSFRCQIYKESFTTGPDWGKVPVDIAIDGFIYKNKEYSSLAEGINRIRVNGGFGLSIPLGQGEYKGGCLQVSNVKIVYYKMASVKDSQTGENNNDAKIDIDITLKDGSSLIIHYRGTTPHDGYY